MWYAECLKNWYNAVDRTFYDAINDSFHNIGRSSVVIIIRKVP